MILLKINISHPKEFYIKIIVIFFTILMLFLIFTVFHKKSNITLNNEEQKKVLFSKIEKNTYAKITKFATYGTSFNVSRKY